MGKLKRLEISNADFNGIKKNKKVVLLLPEMEETTDIHAKDKIILTNRVTGKKIKKKVKRIHSYPTFEDLAKNVKKSKFGLKKKEEFDYEKLRDTFSKTDEKKYGVLGIEVKPKVTFMKVMFVILCVVLACILWSKFNSLCVRLNTEKINKKINELNKDRSSYVFVEINPEMVFTLKNDKVEGVACLNDDCMKMYDEMKVSGLTLKESVESVYNLAKSKGFDTSKGVTVKSNKNIAIEELDYVLVEYVNDEEEKELLKNIKNNEDIIVENDDEDYYAKLWSELKKDSRYDKVYTCAMNEQKLECHFMPEAINPMEGILDGSSPVTKMMQLWLFMHLEDIGATLDKFNIKNSFSESSLGPDDIKSNTFYINGIGFNYVLDYTYNNLNIKNACYSRTQKRGECYPEFGMCVCIRYEKAFALKDLDLLNPTAILGNLLVNNSDTGGMC